MSSGGAQLSRMASAPSGSSAAVACARVSPVNRSPFSSQTKLTQQGRPRLFATSSAARASPMLFTVSSSTRSAPASFITWKISRYSRRACSADGARSGRKHHSSVVTVGAGADVVLVDAAHHFGAVGELVVGPGDVAAEDFRADGAVEDDGLLAGKLVADAGVAHEERPRPFDPSRARRAAMWAGVVPQQPPTTLAPCSRQRSASLA